MSDSPRDEGLFESEATRVLERATEIEAGRRSEVSIDDLRDAALGAGIPLDAFERALSEVRLASLEATGDGTSPHSMAVLSPGSTPGGLTATTLRRAGLVALGGGLSWLAFALSGLFGVDVFAMLQFSLVLAFFSACGLVVARRPTRDVLAFEFDLASLWVGLTLVWMLFDPADAAGVLAMMGLIGGIAAAVGAVLVGRARDHPLGPATHDKLLGGPAGDSL